MDHVMFLQEKQTLAKRIYYGLSMIPVDYV